MYYVDFQLQLLNPNLLYVANWCKDACEADGVTPIWPALTVFGCQRACPHTGGWLRDSRCLPDFWYASNLSNMRRMFYNMSASFDEHKFGPTNCPGGHGIVRGRTYYLNIQLGRYLTHEKEYDFIRDGTDITVWNVPFVERWNAVNRSVTYNETWDLKAPQTSSHCNLVHCMHFASETTAKLYSAPCARHLNHQSSPEVRKACLYGRAACLDSRDGEACL